MNKETRELGRRRVDEIAADVSRAFGATASSHWLHGYPVTWNDDAATDDFRAAISPAFGADLIAEDVQPVMGGEDFSFYGERVPACFFWLGLLPPDADGYANLHAPEFDFNDAALPIGIRAMCTLATASYSHLKGKVGELAARA